jgi:hypothetical protein
LGVVVSWLGILLLVIVVALIAAVKYLPWWALLSIVAVLGITWKYIGAIIVWFWMRRVGKVMAGAMEGATFELHALRAVPPPSAEQLKKYEEESERDAPKHDDELGEDEDPIEAMPDEPPEARHWYEMEITVTPAIAGDEAGGWDPDALMLLPEGTPRGEIAETIYIAHVELIEPDRTAPRLWRTCFEACRLRFLLGVRPGTKRMVFRYMFFTDLGQVIELPPPAEQLSIPRAE